MTLALLCAMAMSCTRNAYTIDGIYTADDGREVFLIDLEKQDTLAVTTVRDNHFLFTGRVKEPVFAYVGQGKERVRFILEPGIVKVDIDNRTESGTPIVDAYNEFHRRFYGLKPTEGEDRAALNARKAALADSVVLANRNNPLGALALDDMAFVDENRFLADYELVSDKVRNYSLVRKDYDAIQLKKCTAPGQLFTDYTIVGGNPDGTDVKLSDYVGKGKFILLDHWASWCGPCKAEMPYIKKVWETFAGDRFDVVSIAVSDKREDTERALAQLDMPWRQILDAQKIPGEIYGVNAIPHLILFAPDGTILKRGLRGEQIYEDVSEVLSDTTGR